MTCDQWNQATAKVRLLPKDQQDAKMDELYKGLLKDDVT